MVVAVDLRVSVDKGEQRLAAGMQGLALDARAAAVRIVLDLKPIGLGVRPQQDIQLDDLGVDGLPARAGGTGEGIPVEYLDCAVQELPQCNQHVQDCRLAGAIRPQDQRQRVHRPRPPST